MTELIQKIIDRDFGGHCIERRAGMGREPAVEGVLGLAGRAPMERPEDANEDACGRPAGEDLEG
jgi:hypothetical protein